VVESQLGGLQKERSDRDGATDGVLKALSVRLRLVGSKMKSRVEEGRGIYKQGDRPTANATSTPGPLYLCIEEEAHAAVEAIDAYSIQLMRHNQYAANMRHNPYWRHLAVKALTRSARGISLFVRRRLTLWRGRARVARERMLGLEVLSTGLDLRIAYGMQLMCVRSVHEWRVRALCVGVKGLAARLTTRIVIFGPIMQRWAASNASITARCVAQWRFHANVTHRAQKAQATSQQTAAGALRGLEERLAQMSREKAALEAQLTQANAQREREARKFRMDRQRFELELGTLHDIKEREHASLQAELQVAALEAAERTVRKVTASDLQALEEAFRGQTSALAKQSGELERLKDGYTALDSDNAALLGRFRELRGERDRLYEEVERSQVHLQRHRHDLEARGGSPHRGGAGGRVVGPVRRGYRGEENATGGRPLEGTEEASPQQRERRGQRGSLLPSWQKRDRRGGDNALSPSKGLTNQHQKAHAASPVVTKGEGKAALERFGGMLVSTKAQEAVASMVPPASPVAAPKEKKAKAGAHKSRMNALKALEKQLQQTLESC